MENVDVDKLNKEILLKIIYLYNEISDNNIYEFIKKKLLLYEKDELSCQLILNRINSILSDLNKKNYIKKEIFYTFSVYYYEKHIDIFLKNEPEIHEIIDEIIKKNPKNVLLQYNNKNKQVVEKIETKEKEIIENFIKKNSKNNIKIKLIL